MYLPTADGGRAVTDALTEAYHVVNIGYALRGEAPVAPKQGARFHFSQPGAVQGFRSYSPDVLRLESLGGHALTLHFEALAGHPVRVATPTFIPPEHWAHTGYGLMASPTLYPGQVVVAKLGTHNANPAPVTCRLYAGVYAVDDRLRYLQGASVRLHAGQAETLSWQLPETGGEPIAEVGLELSDATEPGQVSLDWVTWTGAPDVVFRRPAQGSSRWSSAWVAGVDHFEVRFPESFRVAQNSGRGLLSQGTRDWEHYQVEATLISFLCRVQGIAVCVQGARRYYALLLCNDGKARLIKANHHDEVLTEIDFVWELGIPYQFTLVTDGSRVRASIHNQLVFDGLDDHQPLLSGGIALVCEEGCMGTDEIRVRPLDRLKMEAQQ